MTNNLGDVPVEELRIAGALNGGVSLAVWMGGVAHELNRLAHSVPGGDQPYSRVLELTRSSVVIDVLAGTSAGGINGSALAMAQANPHVDLTALRDLWLEQGRLDSLLRQPFVGQPTSLLQGDDYFLPQLSGAMSRLARAARDPQKGPGEPDDPCYPDYRHDTSGPDTPGRPRASLIVTTTLLEASERRVPDDLGRITYQQVHAGHFRFTAWAFERARLQTTGAAVALASRASAGFPFAFEPTFLPVNGPAGRDDRVLRPDMAAYASWVANDNSDASRFVVDGGLLANSPVPQALDLIDERTATGPVRRVMVLVFPHAQLGGTATEIKAESAPTVLEAGAGMFGALRSHGSQTFVEKIEDHNRNVISWRGGRDDALPGTEAELGNLFGLVRSGWTQYDKLRRRLSAQTLAERVTCEGWSFERIRRAALSAQEAPSVAGSVAEVVAALPAEQGVPYVPAASSAASLGLAPTTGAGTGAGRAGWHWGPVVALGMIDAIEAVLRCAASVAREPEMETVAAARARIDEARKNIQEQRAVLDGIWESPAHVGLAPDSNYWRARLLSFRRAMQGPEDEDRAALEALLADVPYGEPRQDPEEEQQRVEVAARVKRSLVDRICGKHPPGPGDPPPLAGAEGRMIADEVASAVRTLNGLVVSEATPITGPVTEPVTGPLIATILDDEQRARASGLEEWRTLLTQPALPGEPADSADRLFRRFVALDTATWLTANGRTTGSNLPIRLVQLTLAVDHAFATLSKEPHDKVAGLGLGHFAGFLKRSWRANDWIWGRLDAARMLTEIVLAPDRLRRVGVLRGLGLEALVDEAWTVIAGSAGAVSTEVAAEARGQLRQAFDTSQDLPTGLPAVAGLLCTALQWQIIVEELPVLASAIRADRSEKQNPFSRGELFLAEHEALLEQLGQNEPEAWSEHGAQALIAFDRAGIGREPLGIEAGSDAMIRTASNAMAVGATVIDSDNFGVAAIKPFTRVLRGALMLPYWVLQGLTQGSPVARLLARLGVVVGGMLLALGMLGVLGGASASGTAAGVATLLAVLGYSALRTGSLVHGVVLLGPSIPLVAYAAYTSVEKPDDSSGLGGLVVVFGIVGALWVLASLPWPLVSPVATAKAAARRSQTWILLGLTALVLLAIFERVRIKEAALAVLDWVDDLGPGPLVAATVLAVLVGAAISYLRGRGLRVWPSMPDGSAALRPKPLTLPAGVAATWAVIYGAVALLAAWATYVLVFRGEGGCGTPGEQACAEWYWHITVAWLILLGLALLLVSPFWITLGYRRTIKHQVAARADWPAMDQAALLALLEREGHLFRYLVTKDGELTKRGEGLLRSS